MKSIRAHPLATTLVAFALAAAAILAVAAAYGFHRFADIWAHVDLAWLALTAGATVLATLGYVVSYRALVAFDDGPRLPVPLVVRVIVLGFGPFVAAGGLVVDKRALHAVAGDEDAAKTTVLGLGALEWALLAPAACVSAVALLASGNRQPMPSLLWPWALAVPIGFGLGLWLAAPRRVDRICAGQSAWRAAIGRALRGVALLPALARDVRRSWVAWTGMALYWSLDIAAFYGAVRFAGLRLDLGETILAYATGYALTRRSLPLGGAGVTEVLMTFALHWVGVPVVAALVAVVAYRAFNFVLPVVPALVTRRRVRPLLAAADEGRGPAHRERRHAAAPFGPASG